MPKSTTLAPAPVSMTLRGRDVAVHHAAGVRGGQRGRRPRRAIGTASAPGSGPCRPSRAASGLAVDQLHHHVRHGEPLGQRRLAVVVDAGDVRVAQPRGGQRLLPEPVAERPVGGQPRGQHLDRDLAAEDLVVAAPHHRHATGAEPLDQPVPATDRAAVLLTGTPHMPIVARR